MKVTGFTFIRNAVKLDYPVSESIKSILPVCDDFIVAVGNSEDDTLNLIKNLDPQKIKILETTWDDSPEMKKGEGSLQKKQIKRSGKCLMILIGHFIFRAMK